MSSSNYFRSWIDRPHLDPNTRLLTEEYQRGITEFMGLVHRQPEAKTAADAAFVKRTGLRTEQRRGVIDLFISLPVSPFGSQACVTKLDVIVSTEVKSKVDELKSKLEKERQNFAKALTNSSKEDDKTFSILRKTLGCFLENEVSDEEFPPDE
ncbi:hypothetical protein F2Q70_00025171 [Brassica cretica]|uniref:Uncharacterized protein n=1 Tax=Brassica cretica TaxID=69181 RepID=A0A8S9L635_BRACR|nr:hypothetical protein F2Q70_00025171 [Brassica cretica]